MISTIGIKIANGEFYSIVEENSQAKKRLVLTTAHDRQKSVQIDLYKSYTHTMADALYIGSLVVENIRPRSKGEPSIQLVIASEKNGDIAAEAVDLDSSANGEAQTLNVSLKSLDEDFRDYELPDFELEQDSAPPSGLYERASEIRNMEEKHPFPWLAVIGIILVLTAIALAIWYFMFRDGSGGENGAPRGTTELNQPDPQVPPVSQKLPAPEAPPALQKPQTPAPAVEEPVPAPREPSVLPSVIEAPARAPSGTPPSRQTRRSPPVAAYKVPAVIPRGGVPYRIRWGDTLWDIAEAFYRNPWQYPRIARFNGIRNPDLIISGTTIRVPPRN